LDGASTSVKGPSSSSSGGGGGCACGGIASLQITASSSSQPAGVDLTQPMPVDDQGSLHTDISMRRRLKERSCRHLPLTLYAAARGASRW